MVLPILKIFLLLCLARAPGTLADESLPTIYGVFGVHGAYGAMHFRNITLPRQYPRYNIKGDTHEIEIISVEFKDSQLAVFSPDFCETYNTLFTIEARETGIEVILPGSFDACRGLSNLIFSQNKLKELDAGLLENIVSLRVVSLNFNQLEGLPDNFLPPDEKVKTEWLELYMNDLKEFPANIFNKHYSFRIARLSGNDFTDLNTTEVMESLPWLRTIYFTDNLIPCSKISRIVAEFKDFGVKVEIGAIGGYKKREQQYKWGMVEGIFCVDDK